MRLKTGEVKRGIVLGAIAGTLWGLAAILVNALSGAFPFEDTLIFRIITFTFAGAVFGVVTGVFMAVTQEIIPFKKPFFKAVLVSTVLWTAVRGGALFLSLSMPSRYHPSGPQTIQGFVLAIMLGAILGWLWEREQNLARVA